VKICPACGEENPERFRLCGFCGTPFAAAEAPPETRKTVTVVFSDLVGSTSLGESLDSESLRVVLGRYFAAMQAVLEDQGGAIEKFIGDAIVAVFGLPKLREDDAERAVKAAVAMRSALAEVNEELKSGWGVTLAVRTGINTGEVIAGDITAGQRLVTGDTVNVAARLEQAAGAGDILLGDLTHRLVRHAVET
jgi:class 3 adenylate cyclase